MEALGRNPDGSTDMAAILLKYANGTLGVINYFANGHKAYAKERVEVYSQGRTLILDNFRTLKGYGFNGFKSMKSRQDKGHREQFRLSREPNAERRPAPHSVRRSGQHHPGHFLCVDIVEGGEVGGGSKIDGFIG